MKTSANQARLRHSLKVREPRGRLYESTRVVATETLQGAEVTASPPGFKGLVAVCKAGSKAEAAETVKKNVPEVEEGDLDRALLQEPPEEPGKVSPSSQLSRGGR
ncbi:MAG: hypothetical protein QXF57_04945 [Acidilobaceae archaeon]